MSASAPLVKAVSDPRQTSRETPSRGLVFSAAAYYEEQERGDLCYLGAPVGKYVRVRMTSRTPTHIVIHDNHGQRYELSHADHVTLIERRE